MRSRFLVSLTSCALLLGAAAAGAHHSFAVFFDSERTVKLEGVVTDFQFRNPHGLIKFTVTGEDGQAQAWTAETNSPSILMRRGWRRDSLQVGEKITVEGWPARDGSRYVRMRQVVRANGEPLGRALEFNED